MIQKTESKEPKVLRLDGEDILAGTVLKLFISKSSAEIMRSSGSRLNFIDLLKELEITYAEVNPVGLLLFLKDLEVEVEVLDHLKNNRGEKYTIIHVFSNAEEGKTELLTLFYDPNTDPFDAYSVFK